MPTLQKQRTPGTPLKRCMSEPDGGPDPNPPKRACASKSRSQDGFQACKCTHMYSIFIMGLHCNSFLTLRYSGAPCCSVNSAQGIA